MDNDKYIGRLLDNRYEMLEVIGVGGMAVVYKARCHRLNRLVAIKILKDEYTKDEEFCNRFHAEGQAVAMVSHPNIVNVYDVSSSNDADYIVMELIDGISLKQYMEKKGVLNWKETLHFAIQIAKALEHAHSRGIVHRDIKPHNVMVLKNGSVKVTDFGIARLMSESHTLTREALGSVHYISPEQAKGGRVDNRSDIYSLGVVMYEMMAGRPPYNGESPVSVAIQHINGGAAMPSTLNPNIPGGLEQIIMKAMAQEISQRYASATAMLYDMDEFRKNPVLLFDYNAPPTDAVIAISNGSVAAQQETGTAAAPRVVSENTEPMQRVSQTGSLRRPPQTEPPRRTPTNNPQRRRPAGTSGQSSTTRRRRQAEQEDNRMATIAVIACAVVAVIALVVFFLLAIPGDDSSGGRDMVTVPEFLGENYDEMTEKYAYNANIHLKLNSDQKYKYSDEYEKGQIMVQKPASGTQVAKGTVVYVTVSLGPEPETVQMDNHVGKTVAEVKGYLDALKLDLMIEEVPEFAENVEEGKVIRTDPEAGERLTAGGVVILYVSKGPEIVEIEMKDMRNQTVEEAKKWLDNQKIGLSIHVIEEENLNVEEGTILRTKPGAGEMVKTNDTVIVYVAKGMKSDFMPSLVGLTEEAALKAMEELTKELNLTFEVVEEYDKSVDLDKIIRTEPAYNEPIRTGDTVKLYISAKQKAKMPDLVGKELNVALALLEDRGFTNVKYDTYVESDKPRDTVVTQSVEKDEEVAVDTEIVLELSKGSGPVTKKHTFQLMKDMPEAYDVKIVKKSTGETVYQGRVEAGVDKVTVELTDTGKQVYEIFINDMYFGDNGDVTIDFGG